METPSGVLLYISGIPSVFPDRIPTQDLLRQVGNVCTYDPITGKQTRKPLTAVLDPTGDETYQNIRPVSITEFDVVVTGLIGIPVPDFANSARPAIENYFLGREPYIRGLSDDNNKTNTITKNNIHTIVDQTVSAMKAVFKECFVLFDGEPIPEGTYDLGTGELSKLRHLIVNGKKL